ncbi:MAG: NAD-dependent epimerase [Pseudomonadota bacterium]
MKVLVTGSAGFIGFHTALRLIERGDQVVGIDNLNDYYDVTLKEARLALLEDAAGRAQGSFVFEREDLTHADALSACFAAHDFDRVIHLAAQAGVRHSIDHPHDYVQANIVAFVNILEACRHHTVAHLTYASTSSVYGANTAMPYAEAHSADHPLQFYAATKRANELMAHAYANLFALPVTGLRFFTVYGPWGRPDMAFFSFTRAILAGEPITLFNDGHHSRDFTYVSDIAEGVIRASDDCAVSDSAWLSDAPTPASSRVPYRILNIGNGKRVALLDYVRAIEAAAGREAIIQHAPMQPGDVPDTWADVSALEAATGYRPQVDVAEGMARFVAWYRDYYAV